MCPYSRLVALWAGGGGGGELGGDRDGRCESICVYPSVGHGVRLRGEAARRVEAVRMGARGKGGGRVGLARVGWRRLVGFRRGGAAPWLWGGV